MYPIKYKGYPPALCRYGPGKTYILTGTKLQVHVPDETEREDISKYVKWEGYDVPDKKPPAPEEKERAWKVKGSKGDFYEVTFSPKFNTWTCTCTGFSFRRKCSHVEAVKAKYNL